MGEVPGVQKTRITCFKHFPTGGNAVLSGNQKVLIIHDTKFDRDT